MAEPSVYIMPDATLALLAAGSIDFEGEFFSSLADDDLDYTAENVTDLASISDGAGEEAVEELLVEETTGYEGVAFTGTLLNETGAVSMDSATIEHDDGEASDISAKWQIITAAETEDPEATVFCFADLDDTGTEAVVTAEEGSFTIEPPAEGYIEMAHSNEP